jgi:ribosomal subunit interface protein
MELIVKSRNGKVSDRQQQYIREKLGKLQRYLEPINKVTVEVTEEQRRNEGFVHRAQVTLVAEHGILLRAEERAHELNVAVDEIVDTLQRQIQRYKDKHWRRGKLRRQGKNVIVGFTPVEDETTETPVAEEAAEDFAPRLVRTKEVVVRPMFSDEAVEQMELLGHDFFVFRDADSDQINVVYRRTDGNYGVLVPTEA